MNFGTKNIDRAATLIGAALMAAALSSCTLAPIYKKPVVNSDVSLQGAKDAMMTSQDKAHRPAYEIGYKEYYKDPRLQALIDLALKNNKDLRITLNNIEQAKAAYHIGISRLFPIVAGNLTYSKSEATPPKSSGIETQTTEAYNAGLGITNYEFDLFGKLRSQSISNFHNYLASEYGLQAAKLSIVAAVAKTYFANIVAKETLDLSVKMAKTRDESAKMQKDLLDYGMISEVQMEEAKSQIAQAKISEANARQALVETENQLALLIGGPIPDDLPKGLSLDEQIENFEVLPADLSSAMLLHRPDILAAEEGLKSKNALIGAARAAFFPNIMITTNVGSSSGAVENLFDSNKATSIWSFVPTLVLPIFTWGMNVRNLKIANLRKEEAVIKYEKAVQEAFRDVSNVLNGHKNIKASYEATKDLAETGRKRLELVEASHKYGAADSLVLLDAQRGGFQSDIALMQAKMRLLNNRVDLYKAFGGGLMAQSPEHPLPMSDEEKKARATPIIQNRTNLQDALGEPVQAK